MKRKDLLKENKKLIKENIELMNDIYILISDKTTYIDKEKIKLQYINKKASENLIWSGVTTSLDGLFNLINNGYIEKGF